MEVESVLHPLPTIELGVSGMGYDEVVLPVGDGGGGDEHDDDADDDAEDEDEDDDEDVSVLSVNGVAGEVVVTAAVGPVGWMELSRWPR